VKTSRTFLRDCTVVSPMALLLFGGELSVVHEGHYVLIDDWIRIRASAPTAVLVKKLRAALDDLLDAKVCLLVFKTYTGVHTDQIRSGQIAWHRMAWDSIAAFPVKVCVCFITQGHEHRSARPSRINHVHGCLYKPMLRFSLSIAFADGVLNHRRAGRTWTCLPVVVKSWGQS
jgi:hypothetical protein